MKTIYIADDDTQFDDEFECYEYEWKLLHPGLSEVEFYNIKNEKLSDIFSETTYGATERIIVSTEQAAHDLRELGSYTGFCSYEDIICPGEWFFNREQCTFVLKE